MCKRRAARLIRQSARPVKRCLIGHIRSLRSFAPTDDSIGVTGCVITRCTERCKKTYDHGLGSCIEINTGRLRNEIHQDIGPAETETKLTARRPLGICCALSVGWALGVCRALSVCPGLSVLGNSKLVCGEFEACRN